MKIKEIRRGCFVGEEVTPPPPHFCKNPMDLLQLPQASMAHSPFMAGS
jgi:hypothetical protein